MSQATDGNPFSDPSYFLYPHFRVYLTCSRAYAFEFSEFSTIWLRLKGHSLARFICAFYLSPNSSDFRKFFDYLNPKMEQMLSLYPFAEISILGDLNVPYQLCLFYPFTDHPDESAFNFAILHDLEQLVPFSYA
ncbi:hypothetical protein E2C01_065584 [Portunus trituberculatus]|uniref:Endonuclease/exonuclease/phosphatase domain-containing protein n=1 Tax=Portunus trituberculatus TaxID=210409 RepID=A0A5B7HFY5_PORTR|nr:hypothetical protein [Portunus trituberculatus]